MEFTSDDGGLAQEQEQEQEEEKEQETSERIDDQPIIHCDLAFARDNEQPHPWKLSALLDLKDNSLSDAAPRRELCIALFDLALRTDRNAPLSTQTLSYLSKKLVHLSVMLEQDTVLSDTAYPTFARG
jgi:hypothetical protein